MKLRGLAAGLLALAACSGSAVADDKGAAPVAPPPGYDAALAGKLGADDYGMRRYVLVVLKTGPKRMPDGPERQAMFQGHFANINRLADEGKLALAGPFDGAEGWRGLFILAVSDLHAARALVATDPVIASGEMVAEYHPWYGSAALMQVSEVHKRLTRKSF